jgi:hypothetical protein
LMVDLLVDTIGKGQEGFICSSLLDLR